MNTQPTANIINIEQSPVKRFASKAFNRAFFNINNIGSRLSVHNNSFTLNDLT